MVRWTDHDWLATSFATGVVDVEGRTKSGHHVEIVFQMIQFLGVDVSDPDNLKLVLNPMKK